MTLRESKTAPWLALAISAAAASFSYFCYARNPRIRNRRAFSDLIDTGTASDDELSSLLLQLHQRGESSRSDHCIYLDYNGTTPIHPHVLTAMLPYLTMHFGNPSSSHWYGQAPKMAVDRARRSLLSLLNADSDDDDEPLSSIWFTGCGTESDNLAIELALSSSTDDDGQSPKKHIVTSNVEHPAIDVCLRSVAKRNAMVDITFVPVQRDGRVRAQDVIDACRPNTVLVTLMLANNESGALQPVREVAESCRQRHILFHTDAAQAVGKVDVSLASLGYPDMVTIVGHKIGAPKGVAALYVRDKCCQEHGRALADGGVLLLGGGQEFGRRGGTENVPYIVGLGRAADFVKQQWQQNAAHMEEMRQRLLNHLKNKLGQDMVRPNGPTDPSLRLPNTLSVGLRNIHSGELLACIQNQVAASAGAACHSEGTGISAVLQAMEVPPEFAMGTLRLSVGPTTRPEDIDTAADIIAREAKLQLASRKGTSS